MWSSLFELDFWIWATGFGSQNLVGGFMEFDFGIGILEFGFAVLDLDFRIWGGGGVSQNLDLASWMWFPVS